VRVLITGGAGFIGSHLADELLREGHRVRVLDALAEQVHGPGRARPSYLSDDVELIVGDVRDADAVRHALEDVDAVFHLAAAVGVGQSMYQVAQYTSTNALGCAVLLEALIARPVARLIVASSMSVYGEGLYETPDGRIVPGIDRPLAQLQRGEWEVHDAAGARLRPVPTTEAKPPSLASVYALSKFDQERLSLLIGRAYGIPTVALRFFNVYGSRQALSNPYTGVLAIFASRLLNGRAPMMFEDGRQRRDFVAVEDVARACRLALTSDGAVGHAINVGSGRAVTVADVAAHLSAVLGRDIPPLVSGRYRAGDIRHCFADIGLARATLGYEPQVGLEDGLVALAGWLEGQGAVDRVEEASAELAARGLTA
jgi:dTDP-L-rhamnose 4-epimerase